jgi:putative OPT family oligopeptide transporter
MSQQPAPQLTFKAIVLSIVLTLVLMAANAYLGLFAGLTIATAIPAAVIAMAVLRLFGPPNMLENNIVATGASAGSSIASGAIFTLPALVLMGWWKDFNYTWTLAIVGLGGLLGVLFSVPLRRTMIVEQDLQFPEGVAAAEVLKVSENPTEGVKWLGLATLAGGLYKLATSGLRLAPESLLVSRYFGERTIGYFSFGLSPALIAVGYIVGLNIGALVAFGGLFAYWVAIPIYGTYFLHLDPVLAQAIATMGADEAAAAIRSAQVRYIGVGAMLIGGLWTLWSLRSSLIAGVRSGLKLREQKGSVPHTERDLPMKLILICTALFVLPLFVLYQQAVGSWGVGLVMAVIMIVTGFLFCSVAAYMAGIVGSSNSPVSGMTICTMLFAALVLMTMIGRNGVTGPVATILIGAVVCTAASIAGDNLQDLKAGYLIGSTPWRQQVMLAIGAVSSALIMAPVLNLFNKAYGIGVAAFPGAHALPAPQANLVKAVAEGMFGGQLPRNMIVVGLVTGAAIIALDSWLKRRGSRWRTPVLAVAVGIYLPLDVSTPLLAGGLICEFARRWHERARVGRDVEKLMQNGMLFAAGLITGESLMGVIIAIPIVLSQNADLMAVDEALRSNQWVGLLVLAAICYWLYRVATRASPARIGP